MAAAKNELEFFETSAKLPVASVGLHRERRLPPSCLPESRSHAWVLDAWYTSVRVATAAATAIPPPGSLRARSQSGDGIRVRVEIMGSIIIRTG
jgi:hypothetical protein